MSQSPTQGQQDRYFSGIRFSPRGQTVGLPVTFHDDIKFFPPRSSDSGEVDGDFIFTQDLYILGAVEFQDLADVVREQVADVIAKALVERLEDGHPQVDSPQVSSLLLKHRIGVALPG